MDEYQEMERFGMENDYEGFQWIGNDGFYGKKKEKRSQTKEDALYGTFGESDSDSDNGGSSKKRKRRDYTKPMNFVSTGVVIPDQETDQNPKEENADEDDNEEKPVGLGLGFNPNSSSVSKKEKALDEGENGDEGENDFLPTAFGRKIKEGAQRREKEREKSKLAEKSQGGGGGGGVRRESKLGDVGGFEKHTKGIGWKLLSKMGYKGGGLGKDEQGIVAPVEAILRRKNAGMGFEDYPVRKSSLPEFEESKPAPVLELDARRSKQKLWSKQAKTKKKEKYITAEELLAKKEEQGFEVVQKVFDMRGPQVRVLSNLENLNAEEKARENDVPMPELQHNIKLILDSAELDIQKIDRDLRNERETVVVLQKEKQRLQTEADHQKRKLDNMVEITAVLDRIAEKNSLGTLTLDSLKVSFSDLQRRYPEEYKICNLPCIACSYALPLFIRVFQGWSPLYNPDHGMELMSPWKVLLLEEDIFDFSEAMSFYTQLVMEVILPAVRISGINTWEARDPEPMLKFIEAWKNVLPPQVLQNILDNIVMPKLSHAVDSWDPRRETVPIHFWVHPWLPLLRSKLESLYHTIRSKLGHVLQAWHPSDASAFAILSPWKKVFEPMHWEQFLGRHILPKLTYVLQEFQINPGGQKLDQFNWVMSWAPVVPNHQMAKMLEEHFFSKWQQVLYHWLCTKPDPGEVFNWFVGWKGLLPPELLGNEHIGYQLRKGLEMINNVFTGTEVAQPGLRENLSNLRKSELRQLEAEEKAARAQREATAKAFDSSGTAPEMSLKEVMEAHALHYGLSFKPKPGRMHNGHQIYGFGDISIIVDSLNQRVFAQTEENWSLVSLEQLLQMHRSYVRKRN